MVKMLTHRMMDNLSCMLLAKEELQAHLQAQAAAQAQQENMEDSELAKENSQLRRELLEAAADNDAISRSLQERVASLADVTDAKFKVESEAKVLQVQIKSMQKDMEAHKYELHLLRKQLQIRNDEREQNKKSSDASHKQYLDNVKKIARLESECQRLRALIRQRLPGPAVIAQMRAECDMHIKMGQKRSLCISTPPKSLPNSSYLHHQREREALTERLLSLEDEAKFLKEALAKRTAELQEARQLCARTAMKLSSAQDLVEAMSIASVPSTPQPQRNMHLVNINDSLIQDQEKSTCANYDDHGGVYVSSIMQRENIDFAEENGCNNREEDELSCAESWASALFAELSHLSNLHENASVGTSENVSTSNPKDKEALAIGLKPDESILIALQEFDLYSAFQKVSQKLSHVGESILLSSLTSNHDQVNHADMIKGNDANIGSASFCVHRSNNTVLEVDRNFNILDEISHIKHLLLELGRVMEIQGKLNNGSVNVINDDHECIKDEMGANQEGRISRICKRERVLSRFHSMENGDRSIKVDTKFSDGTKISSSKTARMEECGDKMIAEDAKFSGLTGRASASMEGSEKSSAKFSGLAVTSSDNMEAIGDRMIKSSASFSENAKSSNASKLDAGSENANLDSDVASVEQNAYVDVHVDLQPLLQAAQAELVLSRGKIATLEAELSRLFLEKADVAQELSDTCSLKKNLEAELACALANVEELKLQVSSLTSQLADHVQAQDRTSISLLGGQPLTQVDQFFNVKEEQDLAVARAQLADCQRNIDVMRKQMAPNILNSPPSQDVIIEDLSFFDSSSQSSSKSTELNSHLTSPNMSKEANLSLKMNNMNPTEHNNISPLQQEDKSYCHSTSSNTNTLEESSISHHTLEEVQSFNVDQVDEDSKPCDLLTRSTSKDFEIKPTLKPLAKPPKFSTSLRIAEFFNKAKSGRRTSVL